MLDHSEFDHREVPYFVVKAVIEEAADQALHAALYNAPIMPTELDSMIQ